jgi:uncharacterized protein
MKPFFFGTAERRLFGIYEPAVAGSSGKRAAILCYPWGAEYLHSHRILRQLSLKLSAAGFHTLRFDFYGTGDSAGEPTDVNLIGSQADLETAIEELTEITGLSKVTLIGLRLGGNIAADVASRRGADIEALVLWDPVVSGAEYLHQLGVMSDAQLPLEAQGFPLTEQMLRDLRALNLNALTSKHQPHTLMLVTERLPSHTMSTPDNAEHKTGQLSIEFLSDARPWLEDSILFGTVPLLALQRILNWLE